MVFVRFRSVSLDKNPDSGSSPTFDKDPDPGKQYRSGGSGTATLLGSVLQKYNFQLLH